MFPVSGRFAGDHRMGTCRGGDDDRVGSGVRTRIVEVGVCPFNPEFARNRGKGFLVGITDSNQLGGLDAVPEVAGMEQSGPPDPDQTESWLQSKFSIYRLIPGTKGIRSLTDKIQDFVRRHTDRTLRLSPEGFKSCRPAKCRFLRGPAHSPAVVAKQQSETYPLCQNPNM